MHKIEMPRALLHNPQPRVLPDIVPLTVYAPGTKSFEVCTAYDDLEMYTPFGDYIKDNPDFRFEGWHRFTTEKLHICRHGRRHWRISRR